MRVCCCVLCPVVLIIVQIASELTESGLLPWDEGRITSSDREKLGVLYDMLLKILNPDPSQRATVLDFHMEIRRLFAGGA